MARAARLGSSTLQKKRTPTRTRMARRSITLATALLAVLATGYAAGQREIVPVTDAMLRNPDPADWLMWRRTLDSWGYSPLDDIDRRNVSRLTLAWSVDLDAAPS